MRVFGPRFSLSVLLPMLIVPMTVGAQSISDAVSAPASVIVGPFVNLTGNPTEEWIGSGIAEAVRADLESRTDLRIGVVSLGSQDRYGDNGFDEQILEVAKRRAATHVLTGTYQHSESRIRIIARLVEVGSDDVVGVATVDGLLSDLFVLQDQIAIEIEEVIGTV